MKISFFTGFTGILLTSIVTSVSYSQTPIGSPKPEASQQEIISSVEEINAAKNSAPARLNEINSRAARDFARQYKNVSDAEWLKLKKGFVVHFTNDGIKSMAFYTKEGYYEYMMSSYFEDKLPSKIRHRIKSTYYDFNIRHVYEFNVDGITAYFAKIEDNTTWKTIKVIDGEMKVVEEFSKL